MKKRFLSLLLASALAAGLSGFASANNTKLVALTFDDGPNAKYTAGLLDGLSAHGEEGYVAIEQAVTAKVKALTARFPIY